MTRPGKAPPAPREAEIQKSIVAYLEFAGVLIWRNNTGCVRATHKGRERLVRFGEPGGADLIGALGLKFGPSAGRLVAVEVKRLGNRPTQAQLRFLGVVNLAGGLGFWATSVADVANVLESVARNPRIRVVIEPDGSQCLTDE